MKKYLKRSLIASLLSGAAISAIGVPAAYAQNENQVTEIQAKEVTFDIREKQISQALKEFADQANLQVMYEGAKLKSNHRISLEGRYKPLEALALILENTGVDYLYDGKNNIAIRSRQENTNNVFQKISYNTAADFEADMVVSEEDEKRDEIEELEEIIVTGSHIRGVGPVGSQVFTYDREDIDLQGYSTIPQFMQSLPQNFNGGITESTSVFGGVANNSNDNFNSGTGVNLRGLGNVSTLVLLNGQRLSPSGGSGSFVDISMIPLSAIERVEVLADGASAIYGSDAIGGVVNYIMRKNYEGAETRLRYGFATEGGLEEVLVGQTFGTTWEQGHGLIAYEYYTRDPLIAADRSFTQNAGTFNNLLPEQERHSLFLSGGHNLTEELEVFTTAYFSRRDSERFTFLPPAVPALLTQTDTKQFGGNLSATLDLNNSIGKDWWAELVGSFSRNESISSTLTLDTQNRTSTSRFSENLAVDANFDGTIFSMAGGDAKLAIGGHYRRDKLGNFDVPAERGPSILSLTDDFSRDVSAVFGELYLPLVGDDNQMPGVEKLELSVSGRYEHYSDFGSSTDPKVGALWSPVEGLNIRGTYGTSFRAPLFTELDEVGNIVFLLNSIPNPSSGTKVVALLVGAGNKSLKPETATLWSAGFDLQPVALPGFTVNVTYFNIKYNGRIAMPPFTAFDELLTDPRFTNLVDLNGPDAEAKALIDQYFQINLTTIPFLGVGPPAGFDDVNAVFDGRNTNLASTKTTGLDFAVSYSLDTEDSGILNFSVSGTYLFGIVQQVIKGDPTFDVVSTIQNPIDLRMTGGISWTYEGFTTNLAVNYVDSYLDNKSTPEVTVDSWTTVNLTLNYDTADRFGGWLDDTVFSINAVNLFNQDPPFVESLRLNSGVNYDPSAASPVGRLLSFQITKKW